MSAPAGPLEAWSQLCARPQMLSFMHAQHSFFQQGYSLLHQLDPYMKKLAAEVSLRGGPGPKTQVPGRVVTSLPDAAPLQLDQLVIDSAVEKREMERKHAAIQQRVRPCTPGLPHGRGAPRSQYPLRPPQACPHCFAYKSVLGRRGLHS